jgi:hypothetical protein
LVHQRRFSGLYRADDEDIPLVVVAYANNLERVTALGEANELVTFSPETSRKSWPHAVLSANC